jgi:hypothetical protein
VCNTYSIKSDCCIQPIFLLRLTDYWCIIVRRASPFLSDEVDTVQTNRVPIRTDTLVPPRALMQGNLVYTSALTLRN